jgi:hypothetical protein
MLLRQGLFNLSHKLKKFMRKRQIFICDDSINYEEQMKIWRCPVFFADNFAVQRF